MNSANSGSNQPASRKISFSNILLALIIISAFILILDWGRSYAGFILVALSLPLVMCPASIVPLLFISSWSSSIAIISFSAFYYYLLLFVVSLIISRKQWTWMKGNNIPPVVISIFAVWLIVSGALGVTGDIYGPFKLSLCIVFPLICSKIRLKKTIFCDKAILYLSVILSIFFLVRALFFPIEFTVEDAVKTDFTVVKGMGTNCIGQVIVILFLFSFCYFVSIREWTGVAISLLYFATLLFLGSRTALYSSIILAGCFLVLNRGIGLKRKAIVLAICAVALPLLFYISSGFENAGRLGIGTVVENQGSGRFINWAMYAVDIIPKHIVSGIGTGLDNFMELGYSYDSDNLYMDLLCETGLPGFVFFFTIFVSLAVTLAKLPRTPHRKLLTYLLFSFLLTGMGESVFDNTLTWFVFGYVILSANNLKFAAKRYKKNGKIFCVAG